MSVIWDGSEWQKDEVNFSILKGEIDLAILRDQFGYTKKDSQYDYFVSQCKQYGIPFDTYAFFDAVNVSDAVAEANSDVQRMAKESVVAWIDVETVSTKVKSDLVPAVNAYYDDLKKAGFSKVGLYSGEYFYNDNGLSGCKYDCLWIARYGTNDGSMQTSARPQVPNVDIWQYTSKGKLSAISGDADLSILIGSKPLSYFTGISDSPIKEGDTVIVGSWATTYQTGQKIAPWVNGKSYKVIQVKDVSNGTSRHAYLLDSIMSWVWEQDLTKVEAAPAPVAPAPTPEAPAAPTPPPVAPTPPPVAAPTPEAPKPEAPAAPVAAPPYYTGQTEAPKPEVKPEPVNVPPIPEAPKPEAPAAPVPTAEASQVKVNYFISKLEGAELAEVHDYIMNRGWWFQVTKNDDDTLNIEVGIFIKDSNSYKTFKHFLDEGHYSYTEKAPTVAN